ncbi:M15 family metallopeptidase [Saccharibacillus sp. CPCC 101409]|uniref:M15 family metallopeptidase n=1 Tax=Saccharibacillus sp. CPCC 101409 TaxID=3058041 RepID=UPI002670F715|nr:M15 family metallopeptidase [Saccharibacillus sp. CPCC 101409]MDO3411454.1 M15 family metallopeptidase [Saccharibacillus sp. CPCC 101409]
MRNNRAARLAKAAIVTSLAAGLLSACGDAGAVDRQKDDPQETADPQKGPAETTPENPFAQDLLQATVETQGDKDVVTNPDSVHVVVNKQRYLPDGYEPGDLVVPDVPFSFGGTEEKSHMRKEAAGALKELFEGAKEAGIDLYAVSGYRSYKRQKNIYDYNVSIKGVEETNKVSAIPGTSEHQTGLAMDVSALSVSNELEQSFGETKEGRWLAANAAQYGFIIHYLQGKEDITGYSYEPWHVRYVGRELAQAVYDSGLALEEYLDADRAQASTGTN